MGRPRHEKIRSFRWSCPRCQRSGEFEMPWDCVDEDLQQYAPDCHALAVGCDARMDYCGWEGRFAVEEIVQAHAEHFAVEESVRECPNLQNAGGVRLPQGDGANLLMRHNTPGTHLAPEPNAVGARQPQGAGEALQPPLVARPPTAPHEEETV